MIQDNSKKINGFTAPIIPSQRFAGGDITPEGRTCSLCRKFRLWDQFSKKPKGLNGRDSRCRPCIVKIRRDKRAKKKKDKKRSAKEIKDCKFKSVILGQVIDESATEFGQIFAQGICDLLEKGDLK